MQVFIRRRRALLLAAVVVIGAQVVMAQTWDVGEDPNTVTAVLDGGTLTISGAGAMKDYESGVFGDRTAIPWYTRKSTITGVVIGEGITHIGDNAFYECNRIASADISKTVKSIGDNAFSGCSGLKAAVIPDGVESIGVGAFFSCTGLTSVTLGGSLKMIENSAFSDCAKLTSIVFPNSMTYIGSHAFDGCGFTSVAIPGNVTFVSGSTFIHCAKLASVDVASENLYLHSEDGVLFNKNKTRLILYPAAKNGERYTIPEGVDTIDVMAFYACAALKSVVIPNSVKYIDWFAFQECANLTSVVIGSGVAKMGADAFADCVKLTSITSLNPVPPDFSTFTAFDGVNKAAAAVYVPKGSVGAYRSANDWKDFPNILELGDDVSVLSRDRVIPLSAPAEETAVTVPAAALTADFTAGPNPVARNSAAVSFVRRGKGIESAALYVYGASGNLVRKVGVSDKSPNSSGGRAVGSWDLRDSKGRAVPEGAYAVKGTIKTADGKKERVSLILVVR